MLEFTSTKGRSIRDRFEEKCVPEPMSGCWLWLACMSTDGYGQFQVDGRAARAHRVSWELNRGEVPAGLQVLHRCDVRACVNPAHLFLGSCSDNIADKVSKGRQARGVSHGSKTMPERTNRGSAHGRSKLTVEAVREIRDASATGVSFRQLAKRYGVDPSVVADAARRITWRHI